MVIGADDSQASEDDALNYTVGTGAGCFLFGKEDVVASLIGYETYTTDTPDFYRREGESKPTHGGRFTGEPGYFNHVIGAGKKLMNEFDIDPKDIDYAVFHQPTGRFPFKAAKKLGIDAKKLRRGFIGKYTGNTYSASTLIGLANILDHAEDNETIFHVAYGSGAGADAFYWRTEEPILEKNGIAVEDLLNDKKYVDYNTYRKRKNL